MDARRPLTVLRAPTGYGKTTLAAQWLADHAPGSTITAWLRPAAGADAHGFWTAVADTLTEVGLEVRLVGDDPPRVAVQRALQGPGPTVHLVIDDLDGAGDRNLDHELIELLRAAPRLHLLVCVQARARMRFGWLGDLDSTSIGPTELMFTTEETAHLAELVAPDLGPTLAARVHEQSAGWPAITRAALIQLAGQRSGDTEPDVIAVLDDISRAFLAERLSHEPGAEQLLAFAFTTAMAEELTESLAVELMHDPAAKGYLERWLDAGVLLVDRPDGEPVYRWPEVARRLFAAQLDAADPGRAARVHAHLAEAYLDGHPGWALKHALAAKDWPLVVRVIDASWRSLLVQDVKRLYDAVTATPPAQLRGSRRALAMRDVMLQVSAGDMLSRDVLPADAATLEVASRSEHARHLLDDMLAVLVAYRNCAPAEQARTVAVRLLQFARATRTAQPAAVAGLYPGAVAQVGAALLAAGDHDGALDAYREAFRRAPEADLDYLARDASSKLALIHALDGDLHRASVWLGRYEDAPPAASWLTTFFEPAATTAALLTALDRLAIDAAIDAADRLVPPLFPDGMRGLYLYARALLALHDGRAADLLDELDEPQTHQVATGPHHEPALLAAARVDLLLALGRGNQARAVLLGPHRDHPALRVGHARLALLTGNDAGALRYANDPQWERQAGIRHRQELALVHAIAAHRTGDHDHAAESLQRAAESARTTGALRPFTTVCRAELRAMAGAVPGVLELLDAAPLAQVPDVFPDRVPLVRLTRREQLVLEKLASGLTLQQTADALVVSYNTIRSQQASIYHKLGADSRADAVARARQWSLL